MTIKQFIYDNWVYSYSKEKGLTITPTESASQDKSFFKYYDITHNSVDALVNMYLYASHPNLFNDPLDCNSDLITISDMDDVKALWKENFDWFRNSCDYNTQRMISVSKMVYMTVLYKKIGLISLTTSNDDMLMWTHYAKNRGFCLEFDIAKFDFSIYSLSPIHYTNHFEPFKLSDVDDILAMLIQTNIKAKCWEYEKEWRMLVAAPDLMYMEGFGPYADKIKFNDEHNRKFPYVVKALKSVCLGINFFEGVSCFVSDKANEYAVSFPDNQDLRYTVVDYLSNLQRTVGIPIYWADKSNINSIMPKRINILKAHDGVFRIIKAK